MPVEYIILIKRTPIALTYLISSISPICLGRIAANRRFLPLPLRMPLSSGIYRSYSQFIHSTKSTTQKSTHNIPILPSDNSSIQSTHDSFHHGTSLVITQLGPNIPSFCGFYAQPLREETILGASHPRTNA